MPLMPARMTHHLRMRPEAKAILIKKSGVAALFFCPCSVDRINPDISPTVYCDAP
jgi:hypothetical protein